MDSCGHYERWREDFDLVEDLGIQYLRYGPPIHRTFLGPGKYDWEFADLTLGDLKRRDIVPIVDLCHFGVPDWLGNFQNPDFSTQFANYAAAFADRYPWVQLYTPVNEMFICAIFSAKYGWWNEQMTTDRSFVTALKHIVKGNVLAMMEILKRRPDAIFIQSESSEYFHADSPAAIGPAEVMNSRRFLSLDLNYGRRVDSEMYEYLMDNGMTREEYHFFLHHRLKQHCILGNDYYMTNEHRVFADGHTTSSGEVFGYTEITRQYYNRYRLPVMHTETNLREGPKGDEAVQWLWKEWASVLRLRNIGIPTVGFTWYSLTDQVDWDTALREQNGNVNPLGLYDLDRNIREVGKAYKKLIKDWREVLPASSMCLAVPIVPPSQSKRSYSYAQQAAAAETNAAEVSQPANPDGA
jgi:beta-glucosidase/6-phospho-beta-glucosidase/beta-galactosidase